MPPPLRWPLCAARHSGQRLGSLVKPFWAKNSCSPCVKVKGWLQSRQGSVLSAYVLYKLAPWVRKELATSSQHYGIERNRATAGGSLKRTCTRSRRAAI